MKSYSMLAQYVICLMFMGWIVPMVSAATLPSYEEEVVEKDVVALEQYCETPMATEALLDDFRSYVQNLDQTIAKSCGDQQKVYLFGIPYDPTSERIDLLFNNFFFNDVFGQTTIGLEELAFAMGNYAHTDTHKFDAEEYGSLLERFRILLPKTYQFCAKAQFDGEKISFPIWKEAEAHYLAYRRLYTWLLSASTLALPASEYESKINVFTLPENAKTYLATGKSCSNISALIKENKDGKMIESPSVPTDTEGVDICTKPDVVMMEILSRVHQRVSYKEKEIAQRIENRNSQIPVHNTANRLSQTQINQNRQDVRSRPNTTTVAPQLKSGGVDSQTFMNRLQPTIRHNPFYSLQYMPENKGLCTSMEFGFGRVQLSLQNLQKSWNGAEDEAKSLGNDFLALFTPKEGDGNLIEIQSTEDTNTADGFQAKARIVLNPGLLFSKLGGLLNSKENSSWVQATLTGEKGTLYKIPQERISSAEQIDNQTIRLGREQSISRISNETAQRDAEIDTERIKRQDEILFSTIYNKLALTLVIGMLQTLDGVKESAYTVEQDLDESHRLLNCFATRVSGQQSKTAQIKNNKQCS